VPSAGWYGDWHSDCNRHTNRKTAEPRAGANRRRQLRLRRCERRTGPSLTCAKAWTGIRDTPPVFSRTFAEAAQPDKPGRGTSARQGGLRMTLAPGVKRSGGPSSAAGLPDGALTDPDERD